MTEFISRKYGNEGYEIIIKTNSHEHYKATEKFARQLIDHAKPMTQFDKIKAMSLEDFIEMFDDSLCEYIQSHHVEMCRNNSCYCCLANFLESEADT